MEQVKANTLSTIPLGRQGENLARQILFDVSGWESEYGPGSVELIAQRPGDETPYPVVTARDGDSVVWSVTAADTLYPGDSGRCELRYYVGETLAKSRIWGTYVARAMDTPSETAPPEPEQGWVDQIISVGAAAKASADAAKADADRAAALAEEVAEKAAQTAQDASDAAKAMEAAQTAQRLAEEAQGAAETARTAAETAQAAAEQSATDAATAKLGAEAALKSAKDAAAAAAKALADIRTLYQEMQTWAQGVIQDVNDAGSAAVQSVQTAGDAQVQRVTDEGTTQTANAKAQADAAAQSAAGAAQSAQEAAESATVYGDVVADVNQLKQDISNLRFGDPYDGVDLTSKFAEEIAGYADPGAWIRARIRENNFGCIHVNDYIPFTTTNGLKFKARILGIDPYYEYGDSAVGHHIDFICEKLWPTRRPINPFNYNNGLIPTENVTSDGTATQYVLTKPMYGVAKVTQGGADLTGWTYDNESCTLSFGTAPDAGTITVTGTGSEYPWLSCDAYLYANSLAGHVPNGTGVNPAIKRVDYTNDGIYHYLPDWLKAVIIEKLFMLNKRYSTSGILSDENSFGWTNIGKIWFPTEVEVYGCPVWGSKGGYGLSGSIQYPYFISNMHRLKKVKLTRESWWLLSPNTSQTRWCTVYYKGDSDSSSASNTNNAMPICFRIG